MDDGMRTIVRNMSARERKEMLELLLEATSEEEPDDSADFEAKRCPRCGCTRVVRKGRDPAGRQRWLCLGCSRTFGGATGKVLGTTKLPATTWAEYARCVVDGLTLRDAAARCGVSLKTSFFMRHRILEVMEGMLPPFEAGTGCPAQVDETLVPDSLSGNHRRNQDFPCPVRPGAAVATGSGVA
jgi:transposase-like protein